VFFKNYRKGVVTAGKVRYTVKTMWREEIKMEQSKIERINELARKARLQPLSEEEAAEQKALRLEYAAACRASLRASLENTYIVEADGTKRKVRRRDEAAGEGQKPVV
jgi:hypothetical protein